MMDIVIVGLSDNRRTILSDLSVSCKIVGYTDIEKYYKGFTSFDYLPYCAIADIGRISYDYLIIGYTQKNDIEAAIKELIESGISTENVIEYQYYKETLCINQVRAFANTDQKFDMFLFGMSHSQCSIQPQYFSQRLFKFAAPSMDLFCQEKLVRSIVEQFPESVAGAKAFIFELPYYIFNFDLSRFRQFVLNRLFYFHVFSDYHHFGESPVDQELTRHFENFIKVFDRDIKSDKFTLNKDDEHEVRTGLVSTVKSIAHEFLRKWNIYHFHDDVWFKNYSNTQKENSDYWVSIQKLIREVNPNAEIRVLVCPFDPLFRRLYEKQIDEKRQQFYTTIGDVQVIDDFELNDNYRFSDHCHLRTECGLRFTQYVRKQLGDI